MTPARPMDQSAIKRHNIERLLSALERWQPVSRTDLAHITEMSSASVTRIVGALTALGQVKEVSLTGSSGRGRKAINLRTVPDGLLTLGVSIGPQSLKLCLLDFSDQPRETREIPIDDNDLEPTRLAALTRSLLGQLPTCDPARIRYAGVCLSGRVDGETRRVVRSKVFNWTDVDLAAPLAEALRVPVLIENDVKSCLTWECLARGLLYEDEDVAYLYIGRAGIGFAHRSNGRLVRGQSNAAGEIEDTALGLGERLSDHLMEDSLVARARRLAPSVSGIGDILDARRMDLPWARVLMDDFFSHLEIVLQLIQALLDPHVVILGGDIPDALRDSGLLAPNPHVAFGECFEESCALGAAVIAMQEAVHGMIESSIASEE